MHIAINGWFAGQTTAGSGQYIDHMLAHLPAMAPETRFSLLLPEMGKQVMSTGPDYAGIWSERIAVPGLPRNLAKLYWEQISVPQAARRLGADVLWIPVLGRALLAAAAGCGDGPRSDPVAAAGLSGRSHAAALHIVGLRNGTAVISGSGRE